MEIIPAIDLLDGRCVRLRQGQYDNATVYDGDPLDVARSFAVAGARRLHVVDLNAARGVGDNRSTIARLVSGLAGDPVTAVLEVEVGGGVRSRDAVAQLLDHGVRWAVVGTTLARQPDEVARWAAEFGPQLIASIDAANGEVRVSGWEQGSGIDAVELAQRAADIGLAAIEYTEIVRDGTLEGPDIEATLRVADAVSIPVILSGGIAGTQDVGRIMASAGTRIAGCIVGRALYEGAFDLAQAVKEARNGE